MSFLNDLTLAAGMNTATWMELPAQALPVAALTPTQWVDDELWPAPVSNEVSCADPYIHVVRLGSALYVEDGHHRLARALRDHEWTIWGRVLDLTLTPRIVQSRSLEESR